jgi:hypothetical protein
MFPRGGKCGCGGGLKGSVDLSGLSTATTPPTNTEHEVIVGIVVALIVAWLLKG